jgi:hypothetical protein
MRSDNSKTHNFTPEGYAALQRAGRKYGRISAANARREGTGLFAMTHEEHVQAGKLGGPIGGKIGGATQGKRNAKGGPKSTLAYARHNNWHVLNIRNTGGAYCWFCDTPEGRADAAERAK